MGETGEYIDLGTAVWVKGPLVGLFLAAPFMIMELSKDPKALILVIVFSCIMGVIIAILCDKLVPK